MQYHLVLDTVRPLAGTASFEAHCSPVMPRLSVFRPVCPSSEQFRAVCKHDVLNIVLTSPAQLSGAYATARAALAREANCAVLDSRTFGAGQLLLAEKAAELAEHDRFSVRVLRDIRRASKRLHCYFVAPNGAAARLCGRRLPRLSLPFRYTVYRIGEEGEIHRHAFVYASTAQQALYRSVRPLLKPGMRIAVADDRAGESAEALSNRLIRDRFSVLRGECIPTDLPLGQGGFLSVAFFDKEV